MLMSQGEVGSSDEEGGDSNAYKLNNTLLKMQMKKPRKKLIE